MSIKIGSWNVEGRLSGWASKGRGSVDHILRTIETLDLDVLVLPEAFIEGLDGDVRRRLRNLGYGISEVAYGDIGRDKLKDDYGNVHMCILSRLPVEKTEYIRPGGLRSMILCYVRDPATGKQLRVMGIHLEDRSEEMRIRQVQALIPLIRSSDMPTVLLGDFNAMWHEGRAKVIHSRISQLLAGLVFHEDLRYVLLRVVGMATGKALSLLESKTSVRDVDTKRRPTTTPKMREILFMPSIRLIQIDHLFVSPDVHPSHFTVSRDGGSDHRAIHAILSL